MARKSSLFFLGFIILSLAANLLFLLSCTTPTVHNIALYKVNVAQVAQSLQTQSLNNSRNVDHLIHPALPNYWYWGISGVCDVFEEPNPKGRVRNCRRAFPPTQGLMTLLEESLRGSLSDENGNNSSNNNNTEQVIQDVLSAWNATIRKPRVAAFLQRSEDGLAVRLKTAVGLAIAAIVLDFGIALVAPFSLERVNWKLSFLSFVSGSAATAAGIAAILSMRTGVRGASMSSEGPGLAIIIVFVGVGIRIFPLGTGLRTSSHSNNHYPRPRLVDLGRV